MARAAILAVFFCSGAAGLVYEIVWTRALSLVFGVTTYAVATVLATYMGGLALGSWVFGRRADEGRSLLRSYAVLEAGIGAYALLIPQLFSGVVRPAYIELAHLELPYAALALARAALAAAVLLVPTTLMGGTFPILARYFVRSRSEVGRATGALYFFNTAGALAGCLGAGFLLLERFGLEGATRIAAATNFAAAAAALALRRVAEAPAREPVVEEAAAPLADGRGARLALLCIGISGFTALAYEVLWTRALLRYLHNSTYAFTATLATFLAGIALGSAVHASALRGSRRPLLVFGLLEAGVALGFGAAAAVFPHLTELSAFLLGADRVASFSQSLLAMFFQAVLILLPGAFFLGATLPVATEICARSLARIGARVGQVYAVNTVGAILGSLGAGFVLIPVIGMQRTLIALIGVNLALALALALRAAATRAERLGFAAALAALAAGLLVMLPADLFRRTLVRPPQQIVFYEEGATDTVAVVEKDGQRSILYEDRRGTAGTDSYGWNFFLGHLPLLLHPQEPRRVLHICFGVGNSLSAVAVHDELERVDSVELSPHVLDAAEYFWTNEGVLAHPKVRTIIDDGRNFVMASREQYDVIMLEPPEVFTAGVINLYTREFYRDAAARLAPGGLMMQWLPYAEAPLEDERMLFRSFYDVFPNATAWRQLEGGPILLIGTQQPLQIDYRRLAARMQRERVRRDLELAGVEGVDHLLALFLFDAPAFREFVAESPPVTDDRTRLDYSMPRYLGSGFGLGTFSLQVERDGYGPFSAVLQRNQWYFDHRVPVAPLLTNFGDEPREVVAARIASHAVALKPVRPPIPQSEWRRWPGTD